MGRSRVLESGGPDGITSLKNAHTVKTERFLGGGSLYATGCRWEREGTGGLAIIFRFRHTRVSRAMPHISSETCLGDFDRHAHNVAETAQRRISLHVDGPPHRSLSTCVILRCVLLDPVSRLATRHAVYSWQQDGDEEGDRQGRDCPLRLQPSDLSSSSDDSSTVRITMSVCTAKASLSPPFGPGIGDTEPAAWGTTWHDSTDDRSTHLVKLAESLSALTPAMRYSGIFPQGRGGHDHDVGQNECNAIPAVCTG